MGLIQLNVIFVKKIPSFKNNKIYLFPRILFLLLKRFEFDKHKKDYYKLNNYLKYNLTLDLKKKLL